MKQPLLNNVDHADPTMSSAEIFNQFDTNCLETNRRNFLTGSAVALAMGFAAQSARAAENSDADDLFAPICDVLKRKEPAIWLFTGDSITHGARHTLGWRSYPEHFAERLRSEIRRVRDFVINTETNSDAVPGVLADFNWRIAQFRPAVISLMFGMNDCNGGPGNREAFRKAYITLIEKIRDIKALPLLNTTNTVLSGRDDVPAYNEIIRAVAIETKTPLVDHYAYWQQARPTAEKLQLWIEDGSIHPGVYGHRALANLIFRELGIFDPMSPTCRLETP